MGKTSRETVVEFEREWQIEEVTDPEYEERAFSNTAASGPQDSASSPIVLKRSDNGLSMGNLIFMLIIVDCGFSRIK